MCHDLALGSDTGIAYLSVSGDVGEGSHTLVARPRDDGSTVRVMVDTADAFASRHGSPDLVKIDVEGGEIQVLNGMSSLLEARAIRELFIEVHPSALTRRDWDVARLAAWLGERGYICVWQARRGEELHQHYQRQRSELELSGYEPSG